MPVLAPIKNIADAQTLAQAIVNTIIEPFIVLDEGFRVLTASRSFYDTFHANPDETQGRKLFELGDGQWDIPALRLLLETIIPEHTEMKGFEVAHNFPSLGRRTMLLNARKVIYDSSDASTILLAFLDVTERRANEREKAELLEQAEGLLRQKQVLLQEMQHRVANSLQIIASILLLKARAVTSDETRFHLNDAHRRVLSVAVVQQHLSQAEGVDAIEAGAYLATLCGSLGSSIIGEGSPLTIHVDADYGMIDSARAVSIGLIVTELVINAVKHAFPTPRADAAVGVRYQVSGEDWRLTVSDNGIGKSTEVSKLGGGLGTAIVAALVRQLDAQVTMESPDGGGLKVSIEHTTFHPKALATA